MQRAQCGDENTHDFLSLGFPTTHRRKSLKHRLCLKSVHLPFHLLMLPRACWCCWQMCWCAQSALSFLWLRPCRWYSGVASGSCSCFRWKRRDCCWLLIQTRQVLLKTSCDLGPVSTAAESLTNWTAVACSVAQSCPTLCDPTDCSPPGSSVHGILQARKLGWVAIPFSRTTVAGHALKNAEVKGCCLDCC